MMTADSQVHVWPADRPDRPLVRDGRENSPYRYEQLVADMDRAGIDCAVLVPPSIEGNRNYYALEAVEAYPGRLAVMGRFPLKTDESCDLIAGGGAARHARHAAEFPPRHRHGRGSPRHRRLVLLEAERHDIPVMVHAPNGWRRSARSPPVIPS